MVNMPTPVPPAQLSQWLPIKVASIKQYWGSFVKIDGIGFEGAAVHFRLYLCDWAFVLGSEVVADSASSPETNEIGFAAFVGREIRQVAADGQIPHRLTLDCGDELYVQLAANLDEYEADDEMLLMYLPDFNGSYSPAKGFTCEPPTSTTPMQ